MKITILQGAFLPVPPKLGGAVEKMWFALGKEFVKQGHEVTHISRLYKDLPAEETIEGVLYKRVKGFDTPSSGLYLKWLDLLYTLRSKSAIQKNTDIIITNTFWAPLVLSARLKRRCVVDVQRMPKGQMGFYKQVLRLRANSTPVASAIRKEIPEERYGKVVMIPNPLPFDQLPMVDLSLKKKVILYAGRVHPEKGLELLIKAFNQLNDEDWKLFIVGPSDVKAGGGGESYLNSLKAIAENKVEFTGPVYDMKLLNKFYCEASIFVYPSVAEQGETFGLAPLEAMSWGCVPVVSDLACFRDFIIPGRNGLVFNHRSTKAVDLLLQAVQELKSNMSLSVELATEALKVRETHSTSVIASQFIQEFEAALTGSSNNS